MQLLWCFPKLKSQDFESCLRHISFHALYIVSLLRSVFIYTLRTVVRLLSLYLLCKKLTILLGDRVDKVKKN